MTPIHAASAAFRIPTIINGATPKINAASHDKFATIFSQTEPKAM